MSLKKTVTIDARAANYPDDSIRVMAVTLVNSGKIIIQKRADWREQASVMENRLLVTDTPSVFKHWDIAFNEKDHVREVIASYTAATKAGLVKIEEEVKQYQPANVMQVRKMDEGGQVLEFDSSSINNGHMAVMLAVWAAQKAHGGYVMLDTPKTQKEADNESDSADFSMLPFSI